MVYYFPDYYYEFECIADKCPDSCCSAGWQIVIDDNTMQRYEIFDSEEKSTHNEEDILIDIKNKINKDEKIFCQNEDKSCVFLNEKNLCKLYLKYKEDGFCKTCHKYPRHTEEFEGLREENISISCPEVARIILSKTDRIKFISQEDSVEDDIYEDFNYMLHSILLDTRDVMFNILQNRNYSIDERAGMVLGLARDVQRKYDNGDVFSSNTLLDYALTDKAYDESKEKIQNWINNKEKRFDFISRNFRNLFRMEILDLNWERRLLETDTLLHLKGIKKYENIREEFEQYMKNMFPNYDIMNEHILVYFVYTYLCGAVYDDNIYAKAKLSVLSIYFIKELLMALWVKNDKELTYEEIIETVYKFSRELEHSDPNLNMFDKLYKV